MENQERIEHFIQEAENLPTLPGIALKLLEAVKKEEPDLKAISDIIASDPPLSMKVLRIVNSPFYGLPTKITKISHAVNMLGINAVKNLALSFSLVRDYNNGQEQIFDYTLFWKNSLIAAISSKLLAQRLKPDLTEDAFFLGLLHNLGILALYECMPKQYNLVLQETYRTGCEFHEAENQILGFNHMQIGEYLTKTWGIPEIFSIPIAHHHDPELLQEQNQDLILLTKILHSASLFINFFNLPDKAICLGKIEYYSQKQGFQDMFDQDELLKEVEVQAQKVFPIFEITFDEEESYVEIIEEARKELINLSMDFMSRFMELQKQNMLLRDLATHDGLTGLLNYQRFQEILETELTRSKRYGTTMSIILADIDDFKRVNDKFGHLAGDYALQKVGEFLEEGVRKSDTVARYGGEEFAMIFPETPGKGAMAAMERLRKNLAQTAIHYQDKSFYLTVSAGITSAPAGGGISKEILLKRADDALYRAKQEGKNRCMFYFEGSGE